MSLEFKTAIPQDLRHQAPDFMVKFDGSQPRLSPEAQQAAGKDFDALFTDLELANAENTKEIYTGSQAEFTLLDDTSGQSGWSVSLAAEHSVDEIKSGLSPYIPPTKSISLSYFEAGASDEEDPRIRSYITYRLDPDGVVRRKDYGDYWYDELNEDELPDIMEPSNERQSSQAETMHSDEHYGAVMEIGRRAVSSADSSIQNQLDNSALERQLGFNDQPIGVQEVMNLRKMILK